MERVTTLLDRLPFTWRGRPIVLVSSLIVVLLLFGAAFRLLLPALGASGSELETQEPAASRSERSAASTSGDSSSDASDESFGNSLSNQSWQGQLCNGDAVMISYTVFERGLVVDGVEGPDSTVEAGGNGARIKFDELDARVTITSHVKRDLLHKLKIDAKLGHCDPPKDG